MKIRKIRNFEEAKKLLESGQNVYCEVDVGNSQTMMTNGVFVAKSRIDLEKYVEEKGAEDFTKIKSFEEFGINKIVIDSPNAKYFFSLFKEIVEFPEIDASKVVDGSYMFYDLPKMQRIKRLEFKDLVDARFMFENSVNLVEIGGDVWNVPNLKYVTKMFGTNYNRTNPSKLKKIPEIKTDFQKLVFCTTGKSRKSERSFDSYNNTAAEDFSLALKSLPKKPEFITKKIEQIKRVNQYDDEIDNDYSSYGRRRWARQFN